ncbi:MAG: ATP-binding cassette domain-containing protein [Xanthobacteraceae bacterium]|nr:ATP-binding cassette domain-containing protein [Xanthobacteraceae bacterium]
MTSHPLVIVEGLSKVFSPGTKASLRAVDNVSFDMVRGETLALVGESGCGKSTTGRLLMRLIEPSEGRVQFDGVDFMSLSSKELKRERRRLQLVFQDPYSAFNPRMTAESIIAEPMLLAGASASDRRQRVGELLPLVGLAPHHASRYPHQFSGGQRQRIGIARALALRPEFIVCDEPVSALDVSVQAQVINLLVDLQQKFGLTYLFISHDLRVVRHIADRVAVMYLGRIVELADKKTLFADPQHPYTRLLLSAVPQIRPTVQAGLLRTASGEVGTAVTESGCRFAGRCSHVIDVCRSAQPQLRPIAGGHQVACHLAGNVEPSK